jgi:DNA-binding NarL/FixJ family response regulator
MKRVIIVADHTRVVHTIRLALRQTSGFKLVGCVDGRHTAAASFVELQPDVILVDELCVADHALDRIREAAEHARNADCVLLTFRRDDEWMDAAFEAGVTAIVSKSVHSVALGTLLRELIHGNVVHRPRAKATSRRDDCPLTSRELEILRMTAQGMTNGRIASELWVTEQTVKFHLSNTYRKLGVANRNRSEPVRASASARRAGRPACLLRDRR